MDHNYTYYSPLQQNDVVLILGATHGDFIRERRQEILDRNVFVVNVEPTLEGTQSLSEYIKHNLPYNAAVLSCALSDVPGILTLDVRSNLITSALEQRPETNLRWPRPLLYKTRVLTLCFDGVVKAIGKVDKVFCDIEGSELEVFGTSKLIDTIPYFAIAAYHMRDGVPTHETMRPMFPNHRIIVDGEPSTYNKHEVVFFAIKN